MAARSGPGFEHEKLFSSYCLSHGVNSAIGTYRSCLNMIAAHLNRQLGPEMLRSESDVQTISSLISLTKFNQFQRSNFKSVLRKYVEMVRSNYQGAFDAVAPAAIDVDSNDLPERIRTEISRIVRDTETARALKRLYAGQCQLCGNKLEIKPGEFYLEAHHLKPLGGDHRGPDVPENLVCDCPNCHVLLDFNSRPVKQGALKVSLHAIGKEFIQYHNDICR
jgi:5-methylcytosine-specific restriction endonuclease McrA